MERFWSKVDIKGPDDCWLWLGSKLKQGYGRFRIKDHLVLAHRVAFELSCIKIPARMCVLHKCDTPSCVNPNHLFLGTQADNVHDCIQKGRFTRAVGEKYKRSSLTEEDILKIRSLREEITISCRELAELYSVSKTAIEKIVTRQSWKHI